MANRLEFGSIKVGMPLSCASLQAEREDSVIGLKEARKILDGRFDPNDPNDWCGRVDDILKRAIKQLDF